MVLDIYAQKIHKSKINENYHKSTNNQRDIGIHCEACTLSRLTVKVMLLNIVMN